MGPPAAAVPRSLTVRVAAPDEHAARDLADGGLLVYEPAVVRARGKWRVEFRGAAAPAVLIDAIVRSWLRRCGLTATTVTEIRNGAVARRTVFVRA